MLLHTAVQFPSNKSSSGKDLHCQRNVYSSIPILNSLQRLNSGRRFRRSRTCRYNQLPEILVIDPVVPVDRFAITILLRIVSVVFNIDLAY